MQYLTNEFNVIGPSLAFVGIVFGFIYLAKMLADLRARRVKLLPNHAIEEESNLALGISRGGLYIGTVLGLLGALSGSSEGFTADVLALLVEGAVVTAFLIVVAAISDKIVLRGVDNQQALKDGNVAVGLVHGAMYVATGLIAYGSFTGEGGGVLSAVVFFALGQAALLAVAMLYEALTKFNVLFLVKQNNKAAGLMLGSFLVSIAVVLASSIAGPHRGWGIDIAGFALYATVGTILLFAVGWIADKLFLPNTTIAIEIERDSNVSAVVVAASVVLTTALTISVAIV